MYSTLCEAKALGMPLPFLPEQQQHQQNLFPDETETALKWIRKIVKKVGEFATMVVGSSAFGVSVDGSDLDLVVCIPVEEDAGDVLRKLHHEMLHDDDIEGKMYIE